MTWGSCIDPVTADLVAFLETDDLFQSCIEQIFDGSEARAAGADDCNSHGLPFLASIGSAFSAIVVLSEIADSNLLKLFNSNVFCISNVC